MCGKQRNDEMKAILNPGPEQKEPFLRFARSSLIIPISSRHLLLCLKFRMELLTFYIKIKNR